MTVSLIMHSPLKRNDTIKRILVYLYHFKCNMIFKIIININFLKFNENFKSYITFGRPNSNSS